MTKGNSGDMEMYNRELERHNPKSRKITSDFIVFFLSLFYFSNFLLRTTILLIEKTMITEWK